MDVPELAAMVVQVIEEEEAEFDEVLLAAAQLAVAEVMEIEEEGLVVDGRAWVHITVNINEYHVMGDASFKLHFRMSTGVFEALTITVGNHLIEKGRMKRERRPLQDILLMVVWLLATPDSFRSVALRFGVLPSVLYYFYTYVIEALRELAAVFIRWPNAEERTAIKNTFERATGFPGVIGCIDGTHIDITAPLADAAQYINRHHSYSMNVQAIVDSTLLVRHLYVGEVGSMNDARVFKKSPIHHDLLYNPEGTVISVDEHLVGDGAYTQTDFMMVPFPHHGYLTAEQANFNKRLSQSRVRVENAFARGKGKWRRLKFLHARNTQNVVDHITSSFGLHNFTILNGEHIWEENELARPLRNNAIAGGEEEGEGEEEEEDAEEGNAEEEAKLRAAEARGEEKRIFIMNHVLRNVDE